MRSHVFRGEKFQVRAFAEESFFLGSWGCFSVENKSVYLVVLLRYLIFAHVILFCELLRTVMFWLFLTKLLVLLSFGGLSQAFVVICLVQDCLL